MQLILLLLLIFSPFTQAQVENDEIIVLKSGQIYPLSVPVGEKTFISSSKIISASKTSSHLILHAKSIGQTNLTHGEKNWLITVIEPKQFSAYQTLKEVLTSRLGLVLMTSPNSLIISGRLLRLSDWQTLATKAPISADYQFMAAIDDDIQNEVRIFLNKLIYDAGLPEAHVELRPFPILRLSSSLSGLNNKYSALLRPYGLKVTFESEDLAPAPLIRLRVMFAEVSRSFQRTIGIKWPSSFEASLLPKIQFDNSWKATLQLIEGDSHGKVIATPNLLCRSGGEAEFLAGGEFPIRIAGYKTKDVIWKQHGVFLKFKPKADYAGNMSIQVSAELSLLDMGQAVEGIPGLRSNRIQSHFDLKGSQTILLSGLVKETLGQSKDGLPYLSQIPLLGSVFSSQSFLEGKSELVVLVRPEIVSASDAGITSK